MQSPISLGFFFFKENPTVQVLFCDFNMTYKTLMVIHGNKNPLLFLCNKTILLLMIIYDQKIIVTTLM